jgi:hypothetical protein
LVAEDGDGVSAAAVTVILGRLLLLRVPGCTLGVLAPSPLERDHGRGGRESPFVALLAPRSEPFDEDEAAAVLAEAVAVRGGD